MPETPHIEIIEADAPIRKLNTMPNSRFDVSGAAGPAFRSIELPPETLRQLEETSTATLASQLIKRGIRSAFIRGLTPSRRDLRMVGYAFTLRWVPAREDVERPMNGQSDMLRSAVESVTERDVLVMEARGELEAPTFGDILAARLAARGAAGVVTDGCVRDSSGLARIALPAYYRDTHPGLSNLRHYPFEMNTPVACADVLVLPGDVVVGDADGVLVIPVSIAQEVARDAVEQDWEEAFALELVLSGRTSIGLYPLSDELRSEYLQWKAKRVQNEATTIGSTAE